MDNKATVEFVCPIMKNYASMDLEGVVYNAFSICKKSSYFRQPHPTSFLGFTPTRPWERSWASTSG